jgi:hypothetical protein
MEGGIWWGRDQVAKVSNLLRGAVVVPTGSNYQYVTCVGIPSAARGSIASVHHIRDWPVWSVIHANLAASTCGYSCFQASSAASIGIVQASGLLQAIQPPHAGVHTGPESTNPLLHTSFRYWLLAYAPSIGTFLQGSDRTFVTHSKMYKWSALGQYYDVRSF